MHTATYMRHLMVIPLLLLSLSACGPKPAAVPDVVALPSLPPPPAATATPPFRGEIPIALPADHADQAGDVDSSPYATKKLVTAGDAFIHGLYERPFNPDPMDIYYPYLDILETQGFKDSTWGYGSISLVATDPNGALPAQYALELDLDRNGRGDWLIRASNPASSEWSTRGVYAWNDANGDVGGQTIMRADDPPPAGDGYEMLVFDQGSGALTDGAWARISPDDPNTVEIAFKLSMLGNPTSYAMGAWAGTDIDPGVFDHHDALTHAQAGSPLADFTVYPLKALAEIDNTCRIAIGFESSGFEPGLCKTVEQERVKQEGGGSCVPKKCGPNDPRTCVPVTCP